jgi:hypothetical protein
MRKYKDLTGLRFNRLQVVSLEGKRNKRYYWNCICSCGNKKTVASNHLTLGRIQSCGCFWDESLKILAKNRRTGSKNISGQYFSTIRKNARTRNIEFAVSVDDLQNLLDNQKFKCSLTNIDLIMELQDSKLNTASLDRIDSSKGYIISNLHWVHKDVNKMKMDLPLKRFIEMCKLISENNTNVKP